MPCQVSIDYILKRTTSVKPTGVRLNFTIKLEDLDFAGVLALISFKYEHVQSDRENKKTPAISS